MLTLSAPAIRGCALQFSFLLLFFEKLCSWQLPWWPQPLDGSSHKGQLWPEISAGSLHYKLSTPIIFTFHHPQIFCRAQQYFRWTNPLFVCLIFGDWIQKNTKCHQNNIFSLPILNMCVFVEWGEGVRVVYRPISWFLLFLFGFPYWSAICHPRYKE